MSPSSRLASSRPRRLASNSRQTPVDHSPESSNETASLASNLVISQEELLYYLENDISFELDEAKKKGLDLFLSFLKEDQAL